MYEQDDRSDSFRMIGDIIATIAHNHGIDVDAQTNERWRDVLSLLREFDTLADDSGISHHDALQELASFDRFAEHYGTLASTGTNILVAVAAAVGLVATAVIVLVAARRKVGLVRC